MMKRLGSRRRSRAKDARARHQPDAERDDRLEVAGRHDVGDVGQVEGPLSGAEGRLEVRAILMRGDVEEHDGEKGVALDRGRETRGVVEDPIRPDRHGVLGQAAGELEDESVEARMVGSPDVHEDGELGSLRRRRGAEAEQQDGEEDGRV